MIFRRMKITKNNYLLGFTFIVFFLFGIKLLFPQVCNVGMVENGRQKDSIEIEKEEQTKNIVINKINDSYSNNPKSTENNSVAPSEMNIYRRGEVAPLLGEAVFFDGKGKAKKNRIYSVPDYKTAFPDSNYIQMEAARAFGVQPVNDRNEANQRKKELVHMNFSPYYHVDDIRQSIPYLVPRASVLLNDIGRSFFDSLQTKGVPLHHFIVTSVLRTKEDVKKLRNYNSNATENSCHMFGTTFDISYNRFIPVHDTRIYNRTVSNDTLKWILSEVLNDLRKNDRCYVKYEVKQGCFHITTR